MQEKRGNFNEIEKTSKPCVTYLDFQRSEDLIDRVFAEVNSCDEKRQQRLFVKLGIPTDKITPEAIKDGLLRRLELYEKKAQELTDFHSEITSSFVNWISENGFKPQQDPGSLSVYLTDDILGYGSEEKIFNIKGGGISQFDPLSNAIYFNADCDLNVLSHEYIHAASYNESRKSVGFRTVDEKGDISGNLWLDEGCAVIGEHATRLAPPSSDTIEGTDVELYEKGFLWLTKLFCEKIGWTECELIKAYFGNEDYREKLEKTIKEKFGCTIDELNTLFLGYGDRSREDMDAILSGKKVTLRAEANSPLYSSYLKLQKIFKNISIIEK